MSLFTPLTEPTWTVTNTTTGVVVAENLSQVEADRLVTSLNSMTLNNHVMRPTMVKF